jgi:hypothetical protein
LRKSYDYYISGKVIPRKEMIKQLKPYCDKVVDRMHCGGGIYADFVEFDERKLNKLLRDINKGTIVLFGSGKSFYRKEHKNNSTKL